MPEQALPPGPGSMTRWEPGPEQARRPAPGRRPPGLGPGRQTVPQPAPALASRPCLEEGHCQVTAQEQGTPGPGPAPDQPPGPVLARELLQLPGREPRWGIALGQTPGLEGC